MSEQRLPPHDIGAERAVLGSILIDPPCLAEVEHMIEPRAFYSATNKAVYAAIIDMQNSGVPIDIVTIDSHMNGSGVDISYVVGLIESVPTSVNVAGYAKVVSDHYMRRKYISAAGEIATKAYSTDVPIFEIRQAAERGLIQTGAAETSESFKTRMMANMRRVEELMETGEIPGISTGLRDIDRYTSLRKSEMTVIAARPGMGKSALENKIVTYVGSLGHRILRVNLEMSAWSLDTRMICAEAKIPFAHVRDARFAEGELERYYSAVGKLSEYNIITETPPGCTVEWIASVARRAAYLGGLDLLTVDYLQLLDVIGGYGNRVEDIGMMSRGLKNISRELDIPVIALSQLSRACESRQDKRPILSDLRGSGAIEQDADNVWFLYRDEHYNPDDTEFPNIMEVNIAKQRNGQTATVDLYFDKPHMRFANLARREAF